MNEHYPFGGLFAKGSNSLDKQDFKYNGKEYDSMHGLNLYDYTARYYDPANIRFTTMDPMAEKYYSISPYVYVANNPMKFIDPTGMKIVYGDMTDEEREKYDSQIANSRANSRSFNVIYSALEQSKNIYTIQYGETVTDENTGTQVEGQFLGNKGNTEPGGTITYRRGKEQISIDTYLEETFHAFQHENRAGYAKGSFNREFEAKVGVTLIQYEKPAPAGRFGGMDEIQNKISFGDYSFQSTNKFSIETSLSEFNKEYMNYAKDYVDFNNRINKGGENYRINTTVVPYSLNKIIRKVYGK